MTEKKQLKEQVAHHVYQGPPSRPVVNSSVNKNMLPDQTGKGERTAMKREQPIQPPMPKVPRSRPWAEMDREQAEHIERAGDRYRARQEQRSRPEIKPGMEKRTLRQTGVSGSSVPSRARRYSQRKEENPSTPIARRRSASKRKGFLGKLLSLFTILVVGVLIIGFALTGSAFRVEQVSILGTHNQVLIASIQHIDGLRGQNIFLLDVTALTARIELLPLVATASLVRQWPNQLTVTVSERVPVLLWQTGSNVYSVDNQGMVIAAASDTTGVDQLRTIVDGRSQNGSPVPLHPGERLNKADVAFATAVFANFTSITGVTDFSLEYHDLLPVTQEKLNENGLFVVKSQDGWLAYLGTATDSNPLENRLIELQAILTMAQEKHLKLATIDLRFGLRPVYTLKG